MSVMGIDPGLEGAIGIIDDKGRILDYSSYPVIGNRLDVKGVIDLFRDFKKRYSPKRAFLEKAQAMPNQGTTSMFNYGVTFGHTEMALGALKIPYEMVTPVQWTKVMHKGMSKTLTAKQRSLQLIRSLYPEDSFTLTERAYTPHKGVVDAILIAEYGRLKLRGKGHVP